MTRVTVAPTLGPGHLVVLHPRSWVGVMARVWVLRTPTVSRLGRGKVVCALDTVLWAWPVRRDEADGWSPGDSRPGRLTESGKHNFTSWGFSTPILPSPTHAQMREGRGLARSEKSVSTVRQTPPPYLVAGWPRSTPVSCQVGPRSTRFLSRLVLCMAGK